MAKSSAKKRVNFRLHPRVFDSLGSDLVTSDFVAITELVKNAYDAFADRVDISFYEDEEGPYLESLSSACAPFWKRKATTSLITSSAGEGNNS
jgi:hypothetical protein